MSLDTAIAAVKTKLENIDEIGNVYDFMRVCTDDKIFNDLFEFEGGLRGWQITRETTDSIDEGVDQNKDVHMIVIMGYMNVNDAAETEKTFQSLVETVRAAFKADRHLQNGGADRTIFWCNPMKARTVRAASVSGVLCHYCELTMTVEDYPL